MNMRELPKVFRCSLLTPEGFFRIDEEDGRFDVDVDDEASLLCKPVSAWGWVCLSPFS